MLIVRLRLEVLTRKIKLSVYKVFRILLALVLDECYFWCYKYVIGNIEQIE